MDNSTPQREEREDAPLNGGHYSQEIQVITISVSYHDIMLNRGELSRILFQRVKDAALKEKKFTSVKFLGVTQSPASYSQMFTYRFNGVSILDVRIEFRWISRGEYQKLQSIHNELYSLFENICRFDVHEALSFLRSVYDLYRYYCLMKSLTKLSSTEACHMDIIKMHHMVDVEQLHYESRKKTPHQIAEELLYNNLTPEQRNEYITCNCITVRGKDEKDYRIINTNIPYNIEEIGTDRQYCLTVKDQSIPLGDVILTQKLLIEHDIRRFKIIANARWATMENYHSAYVRRVDREEVRRRYPFI